MDTVESSPTDTPIDLSLYLIVNGFSLRLRLELQELQGVSMVTTSRVLGSCSIFLTLSPYLVSFESGCELSVVDVTTVIPIELPDDHGEAGSGCGDARLEDTVHELLVGQCAVLVHIELPEQVNDPRRGGCYRK